MDAKFEKCQFVGYHKDRLVYYLYFPIDQKISISLEKKFLQEGSTKRRVMIKEEFKKPKIEQVERRESFQ